MAKKALTPVEDLTLLEASAELAALAAEIAKHDRAYHEQDAPVISMPTTMRCASAMRPSRRGIPS